MANFSDSNSNPSSNRMKNVLGVGLAASGKSTFIAALWHALTKKESGCKLRLNKTPPNSEYLSSLGNKWLDFETLERTIQTGGSTIQIEVEDVDHNLVTQVSIPDLAGESFESIFTDRKMKVELSNLVLDASGIILFLNAENVVPCNSIMDYKRAVHALGDDLPTSLENDVVPWEASKAPTQVILVDLLQLILPMVRENPKLSVAISLWDKVEEFSLTPSSWLEGHLPLLFQFIKSNFKSTDVAYFGVSAQGGDYEDTESMEFLTEKEPHERVIIQNGEIRDTDITIPIRFLIS